MRRKSRANAHVPEKYEEIPRSLNNFWAKRSLDNKVNCAKGSNYYVRGMKKEAQKAFLKAFIAFPTPRVFYHFIKTTLWDGSNSFKM